MNAQDRVFDQLFNALIGFDRLADSVRGRAMSNTGYPPYDVIKDDDTHYRVVVALAGFGKDDIDVILHKNTLRITSKAATTPPEDNEGSYIYRGIAKRRFNLEFSLIDHMSVDAADLKDGLLEVKLSVQVPEELQPKRIPIGHSSEQVLLESDLTA